MTSVGSRRNTMLKWPWCLEKAELRWETVLLFKIVPRVILVGACLVNALQKHKAKKPNIQEPIFVVGHRKRLDIRLVRN